MTAYIASSSRLSRAAASVAVVLGGLLWQASPAYAQLDPTLFLKRSAPNIIVMLDTGSDMQRDAPSDPSCVPGAANFATCDVTRANLTSSYYDPFIYTRVAGAPNAWEQTLGIVNATTSYRRKYVGLSPGSGANAFTTTTITALKNSDTGFSSFEAPTRLAIARAAIYRAISQNQNVARFSLLSMRQNNPQVATQGNVNPVLNADPAQANNDNGNGSGKWKISMPTVSGAGGSCGSGCWIFGANSNGEACSNCQAGDPNATTNILAELGNDPRVAGGLIPVGQDVVANGGGWIWHRDRAVGSMLDDIMGEATRLNITDLFEQQCRNTIGVLISGGAEGQVNAQDPEAKALTFLNQILGRRVPIYVIGIAPPATERAQLQNIASKSGGLYFEVTKQQIDDAISSSLWTQAAVGGPANTIVVPEAVKAINIAIQGGFQDFADINTGTLFAWPPVQQPAIIPLSEFQVTTPIVGTVNLQGSRDVTGALLIPDPSTVKDRAGNVVPQRSNVMFTAAFTLPGFDGVIRAFRMYKPVADSTQPSGWKFQSDGTQLWKACAPGTTTTGPCASPAFLPAQRNLFTTTSDGSMIAFTVANANVLAPLMNLSGATAIADATKIINMVRAQPIGTILDSTPAVMNPPSLDPPPDDTYPAFAVANKDRRAIIWVGTNRGIFEGIDARLGVEVWGYIPMNLLPKLTTLWDGQAVGSTDFMMDGSPKISDIRQADGTWKTFMFLSQGAGGFFYQAFDVTLANMAASVTQTDDDLSHLLGFFAGSSIIPMQWSFPSLTSWEPNCALLGLNACQTSKYGDLKATATAVEKSVGQTWSDPAVGQVQGPASPYVVLTGSGFLPYSVQQQPNRSGAIAGTTFYMFNAQTGALLDSKSVGSDGQYEQQNDCAGTANVAPTPNSDCRQFKNALHSDPVATGPADSRFITKAYIGDLDGRLWRFDISLDASNVPRFNAGAGNPTKLYDDPLKQPIFASMATVNVGGTDQYIFTGTGSDLLPSNSVSTQYRLLGILDSGAVGTKKFEYDLVKVDSAAGDEKVTTFPAVAGDIVFFTTTTFNPASPCTLPSARLYALTFIGGAAYDTDGNGQFNSSDSVLVKTVAGTRGTAPFIVDQHLVFGTADKVQIFGNDTDYNNGIGQAGIRLLSWREVR